MSQMTQDRSTGSRRLLPKALVPGLFLAGSLLSLTGELSANDAIILENYDLVAPGTDPEGGSTSTINLPHTRAFNNVSFRLAGASYIEDNHDPSDPDEEMRVDFANGGAQTAFRYSANTTTGLTNDPLLLILDTHPVLEFAFSIPAQAQALEFSLVLQTDTLRELENSRRSAQPGEAALLRYDLSLSTIFQQERANSSPGELFQIRLRQETSAGIPSTVIYDDIKVKPSTGSPPLDSLPPSTPAALQAQAITATRIDISWQDTATNETGFLLLRSPGTDQPYETIATLPSNAQSWSDLSVQPGSAYAYRLIALNAHGESSPTLPVNLSTPEAEDPRYLVPYGGHLRYWADMGDRTTWEAEEDGTVRTLHNVLLSQTPLALRTLDTYDSPILLPTSDSSPWQGEAALLFAGNEVMVLSEESSPGVWQPAQWSTQIGFSLFILSRSPEAQGSSWQALASWVQENTSRQSLFRPLEWAFGNPRLDPGGDVHFHFAGDSVLNLSSFIVGAQNTSNGLPAITNALQGVEINEILLFDRAFSPAEREDILTFIRERNGLSVDTSNPVATLDPRRFPLKASVPPEAPFKIGAAANTNFFRADTSLSSQPEQLIFPVTESLIAQNYQVITPVNDWKMERALASLPTDAEPSQIEPFYDWPTLDQYLQWAAARRILLHGHVLVWHKANPPVLQEALWQNGQWTTDQITSLMQQHIHEMISRYQPGGAREDLTGNLHAYDIVNEALAPAWNHDPTIHPWQNALRPSLWHDGGDGEGGKAGVGSDFIEKAFTAAAAARGEASFALLYNDFSNEEINLKSDVTYQMCEDMLNRGVPIDGIGMQMHINLYGIDLDSFRANIRRFRALREGTFEVHITELDIGIPGLATREKLERQKDLYHQITKIALEEGVQALITWGVHDAWSSVDSSRRGYGSALPFSSNFISGVQTLPEISSENHPVRFVSYSEAKPAFFGLREALEEHFGPRASAHREPHHRPLNPDEAEFAWLTEAPEAIYFLLHDTNPEGHGAVVRSGSQEAFWYLEQAANPAYAVALDNLSSADDGSWSLHIQAVNPQYFENLPANAPGEARPLLAWQTRYFDDPFSAPAYLDADPDGDRRANLLEAWLRTDPGRAELVHHLFLASGANPRIRFEVAGGLPGSLLLNGSPDLLTWPYTIWTSTERPQTGSEQTIEIDLSPYLETSGQRLFLRFAANPPQ